MLRALVGALDGLAVGGDDERLAALGDLARDLLPLVAPLAREVEGDVRPAAAAGA